MKYKFATVYTDENEKFEKALVETDLGNIEVKEVDKFNEIIKEFANQEKLSTNKLFEKEGLIKVESKKKKETKKAENKKDDVSDNEYDEIVYGTTKKKGNAKKIVKNLIIYGSVATILGVGIHHLNIYTDIFKKKTNTTSTTASVATPTKKPNTNNNNKTIVTVDSGVEDESDYGKTMEGVSNRIDDTNNVISELSSTSSPNLTEEQIYSALNDNARIANASVFEISQFINGNELTGKAYYYNFENNFPINSADYNAIKVFSDLRNEILDAAYVKKDKQETKRKIMSFYSLYTKVIVLDKKMNHNGVIVDYSELSDPAKATVLELGVAILNINLKDYSIEIDGKTYDKKKIYNDSLEKLEGELIPNLIDKGYTKK